MLDLRITLEKESSFTGQITLVLHQGGIRAIKADGILIVKKDSFNIKSIFERPTST